MVFIRPYLSHIYSTKTKKKEYTPLVDEIHPPVTDSTPATNNSNNAEDAPAHSAPRTWHHTAMSAATFALSAIIGYVATEAICKRIRDRN